MTTRVKIEHKIANQIRKDRNIKLGKTGDDYERAYFAHLPKPQDGKWAKHLKQQ